MLSFDIKIRDLNFNINRKLCTLPAVFYFGNKKNTSIFVAVYAQLMTRYE